MTFILDQWAFNLELEILNSTGRENTKSLSGNTTFARISYFNIETKNLATLDLKNEKEKVLVVNHTLNKRS